MYVEAPSRFLGACIKRTGIVSHSPLSARHGINIVFYLMKRAPHTHTFVPPARTPECA